MPYVAVFNDDKRLISYSTDPALLRQIAEHLGSPALPLGRGTVGRNAARRVREKILGKSGRAQIKFLAILIQISRNDVEEIAHLTGMSGSSLRRILDGRPVSATAARKISRAIGIPTSAIFINKEKGAA